METIEDHRLFWADIAKVNGWYVEPFYVQVWIRDDGTIEDSVSFRGLNQDFLIQLLPD